MNENCIYAVEDSEESRIILQESLNRAGYADLTLFGSGEELLEHLQKKKRPDLLLLDIHLPGMNGLAVLEELTQYSSLQYFPVIMVTTDSDEKALLSAFDRGALDFVTKPYRSVELACRVRSALRLKKSHDELMQKNAELEYSEQRYRRFINALPDIVYEIDRDGRFKLLNPVIADLGYEPEKLIGKHFSEILHPEDVEKASREVQLKLYKGRKTGMSNAPLLFDERRRAPRSTENLIVRLKRKDDPFGESTVTGSVISFGEVRSAGAYLNDQPGDENMIGSVGIIRDVTSRQQLLRQLSMAKEEAEKASRAKSEFLANMSHEIRTPLHVLLGMLEFLEESDLSPVQCRYLTNAMAAGESLYQMMNNILDLSKIESGLLTLESVSFNLRDLTATIGSVYAAAAEKNGLDFNLTVSESLPDAFYSDPLRIKQIINNLLGNAVKFTREGSISLEVREGSRHTKHMHVLLIVTDTGPGIPAEKQNRVFQSFEQEDISTTRKFGGSGLGLSIVRHLTNLLQGTVKLESPVNENSETQAGTRFTVELPLQLSEKESKDHDESIIWHKPEKPVRKENYRILVLEDNIISQTLIRNMLEAYPVTVDIADNGCEGLKLIQSSEEYDLVFSDLHMPVQDGYAFTEKLRSENRKEHVIACTADAMREDIETCHRAGFSGLLLKPFKKQDLYELMKHYLNISW